MAGPIGSSQWSYSVAAGGFYDHQIEQSLFITGGGTHGLNRTLGTPTNEYKLTLSCWIKRAEIGNTNIQEIFKLSVNDPEKRIGPSAIGLKNKL